jgi:hypothetical protein
MLLVPLLVLAVAVLSALSAEAQLVVAMAPATVTAATREATCLVFMTGSLALTASAITLRTVPFARQQAAAHLDLGVIPYPPSRVPLASL